MPKRAKREIIAYLVSGSAAALLGLLLCYLNRDYLLQQWWIYKLQSTDPAVRNVAARKLGDLGSVVAVPVLLKYLVKGDNPIGNTEVPENYLITQDVFDAIRKLGERAVPLLIEATRSEEYDSVKAAIIALGYSRTKSVEALHRLRVLTKHDRDAIRRLSVWALQALESNDPIDPPH